MHFVISIIHLKQIKRKFYEKKIAALKIFDSELIIIQKQFHYVKKNIKRKVKKQFI